MNTLFKGIVGWFFLSYLYCILSAFIYQKYLGVSCSVLGILVVKQESPNEPSGNLTTQKSPPPLLNILAIIPDLVSNFKYLPRDEDTSHTGEVNLL